MGHSSIRDTLARLWGKDVFVSYSRADGATYAMGVAARLAERNFACVIDQWGGSPPGRNIPRQLRQALRNCRAMVVVATRASGISEHVRQEIEEFVKTGGIIVPIDLDGYIREARWWPTIEGLAISQDVGGVLPAAPSDDVIDRIANSLTFRRRDQRLRRMAFATLAVLVAMLGGLAVLGMASTRLRTDNLEAGRRLKFSQREARRQLDIAEATRLATLSTRNGDPSLAGFLAASSLDRVWTLPGSRSAMDVLAVLPRPIRRFWLGTYPDRIALSPDGSHLAIAESFGTKNVRLWNIADARETSSPRQESIEDLTFSHDGTLLADASCDGAVTISSVPSGRLVTSIAHADGWARTLAFTPDDRLLAVAGRDLTAVYEVSSGRRLLDRENDGEQAYDVVVTPDGSRIVVASSQYAAVVRIADGSSIVLRHPGLARTLAVSPNGQVLAVGLASGSDNVFLWNIATGQKLHELPNGADAESLAFSPDGKSLLVGTNGRMRAWDWRSERVVLDIATPSLRVAISADGSRLFASGFAGTRVFDAQTGANLASVSQDGLGATAAFSTDGRWIATAAGEKSTGEVQVRPSRSMGPAQLFRPSDAVRALVFSPDGQGLVTGARDGEICLWDVASGAADALTRFDRYVSSVGISPNGRLVAAASDQEIRIIDLADRSVRSVYQGKENVEHVRFGSDGHTLGIVERDRRVVIHDLATGMTTVLAEAIDYTTTFLGSDLSWIGSTSSKGLILVLRGTVEARLRLDTDGVIGGVAVNPAQTRIAVTDHTQLKLFRIPSGKLIFSRSLPTLGDTVAFDPSGRWLAVGHGSSVSIFDARAGEHVSEIAQPGGVWSLAFDPSGHYLAVGTIDQKHAPEKVVSLWLWQPGDLKVELCRRIDRVPTQSSWSMTTDNMPYSTACADGGGGAQAVDRGR